MPVPARDCLPCRHTFSSEQVESTKDLLLDLPRVLSGDEFVSRGVEPRQWPGLLRAAVESLRGTSAATTTDKYRFVKAVLEYGSRQGAWVRWSAVGTAGRNDFRVALADGTQVSIEAKGCPDGNNTTIWDRPGWADEFLVWCQCPESLVHDPGEGAWSGIGTRILPKCAAEKVVVDGFIFWDGRCGTDLRLCPKDYGVFGTLRSEATDIVGQYGKPDWLPPPCIYLLPRSVPNVSNNATPKMHSLSTLKFAKALLDLFQVPHALQTDYVHEASISARNVATGTQIQISVKSRCWPDGSPRVHSGAWKPLRRE